MSGATRFVAESPYRALASAGLIVLATLTTLTDAGIRFPFFRLDVATAGTALVLLAAMPWLVTRRGPRLLTGSIEVPATAFLLVALVSCAANGFAVDDFVTVVRYAGYVGVAVITASLGADARVRRALAWAITFGTVGSAVVGMAWYVRTYLGFAGTATEAGTAVPDVTLRVAATFGNPNFYGEFLLLAIAVAAYLAITERRTLRALAGTALALQLVMLALTYTRGSWLALIAGVLIFAVLVDVRLIWGFAISGALALTSVPSLLGRFLSVFSTDGTGGFRLWLWRIAAAAIADRPVLGWGPGSFYDAFAGVVAARPWLGVGYAEYGAHNSYLTLFAETGALGGAGFVWLVGAIVALALRGALARARGEARAALASLAAGLFAFTLNALTSNSFQHPQAAVYFWIIGGMAVGYAYDRSFAAERAPVRESGALARLFDSSMTGRVTTAITGALASAWKHSWLAAALAGMPPASSGMIGSSRLLGWLSGLRDDSR